MITVTENIKQAITDQVADGLDCQVIITNLVESGLVDEEYPQLYRPDGSFDEELDNQIQNEIILEIKNQLK